MKSFYDFSSKLSLWGAYLSAVLIVSLVVLIMVEIVGRQFFDTSTMIADEYSGYLYLASIFLGLAYTFEHKAHIRINIITSRLDANKNKTIDIVASVLSLAILSFVLYRTILFTYDSYDMEMLSEAVSETPLYLTQIVMPVGIGLFVLSILTFMTKRINNDS